MPPYYTRGSVSLSLSPLKAPNVSLKPCSRQAGKWKSVAPLMAELPEGKDRPHNVLGWMRALEGGVDKRVGAKQGRYTPRLFQLNVSTF